MSLIIINDDNYKDYIGDVIVDGENKARGLIPRDYSKVPVGFYSSAPPWSTDIPLIPRSEWSDRIKEKVKRKSNLSDIRKRANGGKGIPSLDQGNKGYCTSEDSEVLTENGWVPWPEYNGTDKVGTINQETHELEFQTPTAVQKLWHDGDMVYCINSKLDFAVTPNHRMWLRKWNESERTLSSEYSFILAKDIGWYAGVMAAGKGHKGAELDVVNIPGDRSYNADDFIALLGLVISYGYAGGSPNTKNWVSFASFRPELVDKIAALGERLGFTRKKSNPNVWIRYSAGPLAEWIRQNCYHSGKTGAQYKRIPALIQGCSQRQIKLFLEWFDDRNRAGDAFYSTSKVMIDDLQALHLRIGKRCSFSMKEPKVTPFAGNKAGCIKSGILYTLHVSNNDRLCIDKKDHIENRKYTGFVYCVTVPNSTLITRRNGCILISGNCWAHSPTIATMLLRAKANMPYVRLSAYAIACIIKQYRDEGGWGAHALDFISTKGVPSVEFWPEKSMARTNDKPETWANAKTHRVTEGWADISAAVYDRDLTFDQVATALLLNFPVIGDFNWWGHSICLMDLVEVERGSFGVRFINSWSDKWGENGEGILQGKKAIPDGATAARVTTASIKSLEY